MALGDQQAASCILQGYFLFPAIILSAQRLGWTVCLWASYDSCLVLSLLTAQHKTPPSFKLGKLTGAQ